MTHAYLRTAAAAVSTLLLATGPALAQRATVTTAADSGPGSLRDLITASDASEIDFAPALAGATITLSSPIAITRSIELRGSGADATVITGASGAFRVTAGEARFSDLAIVNSAAARGGAIYAEGADVYVFDARFEGNRGGGGMGEGGGAIYGAGGTIYVQRATFTANAAAEPMGSGGAIFAGEGAELRVLSSTFDANEAVRAGGAIEDASGAGTESVISGSAFTANVAEAAPGNGGAFHATGNSSVSVRNSTFRGNRAVEGGALWNGAGEMAVSGVTLEGNVATGDDADQGGGAIFAEGGRLLLTGATVISGNSATGASGSGGGVFVNEGAQLGSYGTTVSGNSASRAGGGIEDASGATTTSRIASIRLLGNTTGAAPGNGGGYHVTGAGDVSFHGGVIRGNTAAAEGGGLWNGTGTMTVLGATIDANVASGDDADQGGGGIFNNGGTLKVKSETLLSDNVADGDSGSGGAILTVEGGSTSVAYSSFTGNASRRAGGAIEDQSGAGLGLSVYGATFTGNTTGGAPGNGGAIHITGAGDSEVSASAFTGNTAAREGGALWNGTGEMVVRSTDVAGNVAEGDEADQGGGGVFNAGGRVTFTTDTRVRDNRATGAAGSGGGVFNAEGGTLTIYGGAITGNVANRAGGGIEDASGSATVTRLFSLELSGNVVNEAPGNGGGFHATGDGDVLVNGATVVANTAGSEGGGLWNGSGTMTVRETTFSGNVARGDAADNGGGAIFNLAGALEVETSAFSENAATGASGSGGAILFDAGSRGRVAESTFTANAASRAGGAVEDNSGRGPTIAFKRVTFDGNRTGAAPGNGGAIHVTGAGNVNVTLGSVVGNTAANEGGGLWNGSGTMNVTQVSVRGNTAAGAAATNGGGGIFNNGGTLRISRALIADNASTGAEALGGGIHNAAGGRVRLSYSTVSGNSSAAGAGGLASYATAEVRYSTIALNDAQVGGGIAIAGGTTTLLSSILADNDAPTGANLAAVAGDFASAGFNAVGLDELGIFPAETSDQVGTPDAPLALNLQPLARNGGPTLTHAITCGSVAIDMGDDSNDERDQRGFRVTGRRDIGAFDLRGTCPGTETERLAAATFDVYPTQTHGHLTLERTEAQATGGAYTYFVTDARGEVVREIETGSERLDLSVGDLQPGMYFVQRLDEDGGIESHGFQVLR